MGIVGILIGIIMFIVFMMVMIEDGFGKGAGIALALIALGAMLIIYDATSPTTDTVHSIITNEHRGISYSEPVEIVITDTVADKAGAVFGSNTSYVVNIIEDK